MITRRIFTVGAATAATAVSYGLPQAQANIASQIGVSPRMALLADAWEATALEYDAVRHETFQIDVVPGLRRAFVDANCPELVHFRSVTAKMLDAVDVLMREPSRTRSDVLLKYHVMDMFMGKRPVHDMQAIVTAGGAVWHDIVEHEAKAFGLQLNYFWLSENGPFAQIDDDTESPLWTEIARWRTPDHVA